MKYYLAHHGKQGQHWGVRHGPPYPLDSNASKQAKRKSASKSSYDKLYGDKKGSTKHTGSLLRDSNKTKEVSILKRKDILENRLRNKSITRDEMIELTDINKVIRDLNSPRLDLSQKRSDTMNKEEIAKEQKRKRIKEGVAVTAGVIGLVTVAAKARKAYLESEKASLDLKKIKDGADAAKKVVESYSENKDTIKEGMKFAKEGVDAFTEAPASFSDVVKATSSAKNAVGDLVINGVFRDISHSDLSGLYLAHHGVQNQHWGVRHGPPYPLDSNASKQAKRKSASKSSYDKLYGDKKGSNKHTGTLIGPAVGVGVTAAYAAGKAIKYKVDQRKNIQSISDQITDIKLLEPRLNDISSELKPMDLKSSYKSLKKIPNSYEDKIKDIKNINKISKSSPDKFNETTENCCNCVTAYILRQAGYDVKAKPFTRESVKYRTDTQPGLVTLSQGFPTKIKTGPGEGFIENLGGTLIKENTTIAYASLMGHAFIIEREGHSLRAIDPQNPKSSINNGNGLAMLDVLDKTPGHTLTIIPVNIDKLKSGKGVKYYDKFVSPSHTKKNIDEDRDVVDIAMEHELYRIHNTIV